MQINYEKYSRTRIELREKDEEKMHKNTNLVEPSVSTISIRESFLPQAWGSGKTCTQEQTIRREATRGYDAAEQQRLEGDCEWIHKLHLAVLTKNERLIVTTMLLDDFTMINF